MNIDIYPLDFPNIVVAPLTEEVSNLRSSLRLAIKKEIYNRRIVTQLVIDSQDSEVIPTRMPFSRPALPTPPPAPPPPTPDPSPTPPPPPVPRLLGRVGYFGGGTYTDVPKNATTPAGSGTYNIHAKNADRLLYASETLSRAYFVLTTTSREEPSSCGNRSSFWVFGGQTDPFNGASATTYSSIEQGNFADESMRRLGSRLTRSSYWSSAVGNTSNAYIVGGNGFGSDRDANGSWGIIPNRFINKFAYSTKTISLVGDIGGEDANSGLVSNGNRINGYFFGGFTASEDDEWNLRTSRYRSKKIYKLNYASQTFSPLSINLVHHCYSNFNSSSNGSFIYLFGGIEDNATLFYSPGTCYTAKFNLASETLVSLGGATTSSAGYGYYTFSGVASNNFHSYIYEYAENLARKNSLARLLKFTMASEVLAGIGISLTDNTTLKPRGGGFTASDYSPAFN